MAIVELLLKLVPQNKPEKIKNNPVNIVIYMMASHDRYTFHITDPLGESTAEQWIPLAKGQ